MSNPDSSCKSGAEPHETDVTRRSAIKGMATGAAAGAFAFTSIRSISSALGAPLRLDAITSDEWKKFVGNGFRVTGPLYENEIVDTALHLEQVVETDWNQKDPNRPSNVRPSSISLLFSSNQEIPNATYAIEHRQLGKSNLFLHAMPGKDIRGKRVYEIILN